MILSIAEIRLYSPDKENEFCGSHLGGCARYCLGIGERSGCSGCAATKGACEWCTDPANGASGVCLAAGEGRTCGTSAFSSRLQSWKNGASLCPVNVTREPYEKGYPPTFSARHREHSFSHSHNSWFCQFPIEPMVVDRCMLLP